MKDHAAAMQVFEALHAELRASEKTTEPMNALVVWTELGKGLAGKLERQGADVGLLGRLVARYCREGSDGQVVDLDRWVYRVDAERRLSPDELAGAIARSLRAIELRVADRAAGAAEQAQMELFLDTVRGWFPVGLDIMRSMPAFRGAGEGAAHAALAAWCARYLPVDTAGPTDLGIRAEKRRTAGEVR